MFFNLPTLLTWARILAIPLIVGLFYLTLPPAMQNLLATALFVAMAALPTGPTATSLAGST